MLKFITQLPLIWQLSVTLPANVLKLDGEIRLAMDATSHQMKRSSGTWLGLGTLLNSCL